MTCEHGDMWTCGRCGRDEFSSRTHEQREVRPDGWERMTLRRDPHARRAGHPDAPRAPDPTVKDLCGECVAAVREVWDGGDRAEIRKNVTKFTEGNDLEGHAS